MRELIAEYNGCHGLIVQVHRTGPNGRKIRITSVLGGVLFTREQYAGFIRLEFERLKAAGEIKYNEESNQ